VRIGLISDTHIPEAGKDLWPQVYDALQGVDLILHAGDLHIPNVLDWLERLAPVVAVAGNGDYLGWQRSQPPTDPRLKETQLLDIDGLRIGLVHDFPVPSEPPYWRLERLMDHYFGGPVNVIVRGNTHVAQVITIKGVLIVNPGSPTFPNNQQLRLGTLGFLEIENGRVRPSIVQLV